jgi:ribonuclease D
MTPYYSLMTQSLHLPAAPDALVQTPEALAGVCDHLRAAKRFAFDTEFIGENTYHPILCLIQVATEEKVDLIDPLAMSKADLQPFWKLLADPALEKICHAGDQDVEIAWLLSHHVSHNMFDTQIGAGMLGIAYPTALWRVVEFFTGITLEKAHTYSAWNRRPLSQDQFTYAIDDVRYLPAIHTEMEKRIADLGHLEWMHAACQEMCDESAKPSDARKLFVKIRGAGSLKSDQLSVLRELVALREQLAFEHDVPPRTLLKDDPLFDIATRLPQKVSALAAIRDVPKELVDDYGDEFIETVARGIAVPKADRPSIHVPPEDPAEIKRLAETLWVATQVICLGQSVTPSLVTSQNEILSLARLVHKNQHIEKHPLLAGWHRECLGDKLLAFMRNELHSTLTLKEGALHAKFTT